MIKKAKKGNNGMGTIFMMLMISVLGFLMVIFGSTGILGIFGIMPGFFGGIMMLMAFMMLVGPIMREGLLPYWAKLRDDEEITWHITRRGKFFPFIVKNRKEGLLYWNKHFFADAKGAMLTSLTGKAMSLSLQRYGYTLDPPTMSYFQKVKKDKKLKTGDEYEEALALYLGKDNYEAFKKKFRDKTDLPDKFDIQDELTWLLDYQKPADALEYNIAGEVMGWKDILGFMKYSYDTAAVENSIEREKLDILMRQSSYNQEGLKAINYAIAIVIVLIGLGVAFYIFQNIDIGSTLGGLFGGK